MIDSSLSELSSMKVIENSSDGRGYDGGEVGGSIRSVRVERGSDSVTDDRPGGKEPAVQGCGCMSAATFAKTVCSLFGGRIPDGAGIAGGGGVRVIYRYYLSLCRWGRRTLLLVLSTLDRKSQHSHWALVFYTFSSIAGRGEAPLFMPALFVVLLLTCTPLLPPPLSLLSFFCRVDAYRSQLQLAVFVALYYATVSWTIHYDDSTGKLCSF